MGMNERRLRHLSDWDWSRIEDLRARVARHGSSLSDAIDAHDRLLRGHAPEPVLADRVQAISYLHRLLMACDPRAILALGHGPGPDLGERARLAGSLAAALVPGVPDQV